MALVNWTGRGEACASIPGKILQIEECDISRIGRVQSGGIVRQVRLDFVPEARLGDFVMVHVGFAISVVDAEEAEHTYHILQSMGLLDAELPREETF
jgi:hydrogenase expression/formation protein HypC